MGCMPHQIQLSLAPKGVKIKILVMVNYFWKLMTHIDTPMNSETVPLAVGSLERALAVREVVLPITRVLVLIFKHHHTLPRAYVV